MHLFQVSEREITSDDEDLSGREMTSDDENLMINMVTNKASEPDNKSLIDCDDESETTSIASIDEYPEWSPEYMAGVCQTTTVTELQNPTQHIKRKLLKIHATSSHNKKEEAVVKKCKTSTSKSKNDSGHQATRKKSVLRAMINEPSILKAADKLHPVIFDIETTGKMLKNSDYSYFV